MDVLRLLAYEKFAGASLPPSAMRAAELWRKGPHRRKAGAHLAKLATLLENQKAYGAEVRELLKAIDLEMPGKDKDGENEKKG